jgi:DNA-binding beta-propeller fold protein YncE
VVRTGVTVEEELRFYIEDGGKTTGPFTDDEVRHGILQGEIGPEARARLAGSAIWAPVQAWAMLAGRRPLLTLPPAPAPASTRQKLTAELSTLSRDLFDMLLWCLHENGQTFGPLTGEQLRRAFQVGRYRDAHALIVGTGDWLPVLLLLEPASYHPPTPRVPELTTRCPTCRELIPLGAETCPECGESVNAASTTSSSPATSSGRGGSSGTPSIPDDLPGASWLAMHWRPLATIGAITALVCTGVVLRYLAPDRFMPPRAVSTPAAVAPTCPTPCWNGEACQLGQCVWQRPNDVTHVAADARISGPFTLPKDVSDALPLDADRFAVALLTGTQIQDARTGEVLSLVSDAPQTRRLYRVGDVVYATAPQRIYVIDAATTRLLKTIELGAIVGEMTLGASGRRALVSLPTAHAVAVLATEYHAEVDRIQFGDDTVGPMGTDDTGKRALTTTGQVPLAGLRDPPGGAVYAFDPSRLASEQDRVRASMLGNPVSVLMTPDGEASYVVLRAEDAVVPLEWLPSGAVRQREQIRTCRQPEQIELVRRDRYGVVRCNEGRAIQVFDLMKRELVRSIPFNARAADMVISPDGEQAVVALPGEDASAVALVDLKTFAVKILPLGAEPTRVRMSPDGSTALVLSDRAKVAWVLR